ncbi:MAG: hypothetical protein RIF41_14820 [Polyangiaceae bacterium]
MALAAMGCGDDLCEDAQVVCAADGSNLSFERDCPDEATECLASCIVDTDDCSPETLERCDEICRPFVEG